MIDFWKHLWNTESKIKTNPIEVYQDLDRKTSTWPLRDTQIKVLEEWYTKRQNDKDIIIKLPTWSWKTLIGLLMLKSRMNQKSGSRALFVCPNKYLVHQTLLEAQKFWIDIEVISDDLSDWFLSWDKIGITHVQKVFNGKSKFWIWTKSVSVDAIILDDSHACIDSIQDNLSMKIQRNNVLYRKILWLFEHWLVSQSVWLFIDIRDSDTTNSVIQVPYRSYNDKLQDLLGMLKEHITDIADIGLNRDLFIKNPHNYQITITWFWLEISPISLPIDLFKIFDNANQRILMSATTQDDAFFIKWLWFNKESVENPIIDDSINWSGEKMIIIPALMNEEISRRDLLNRFVKTKEREYWVVWLTSSFNKALDYEPFWCIIARNTTIEDVVEHLKSWKYNQVVVFANRYDWIDLPDKACNLLILDWMPYFDSLSDRYEEYCRSSADIINIKLCQKIEQWLWRSVRGDKDYSAIILCGNELVRFMKNPDTNKYFSPQTKMQILIWKQIVDLSKQEAVEDDTNKTLDVIEWLISQCVNRNNWRKDYYKLNMEKIDISDSYDRTVLLEVCVKEKEAATHFKNWTYAKAIENIQDIINDLCSSDEEKWWFQQVLARYAYYSWDMEKFNSVQSLAFKNNNNLLKPMSWVVYQKIWKIDSSRHEIIRNYVKMFASATQLLIDLDTTLSNLVFGVNSNTFELTVQKIWQMIWLISQRPDKEIWQWPDNVWFTHDWRAILIECKNEVSESREKINKSECSQYNTHIAWFRNQYWNIESRNILVIPTNGASKECHFSEDVYVMRKNKLLLLRNNIRNFYKELCKCELTSISDSFISDRLSENKLTIDDLLNEYVEEIKII